MLNSKIALENCVNWIGVQFYNRDFIISIYAVENYEIRSMLNCLESALSLQIIFSFLSYSCVVCTIYKDE
jgi:hypothetical protein